MVNSGSTGMPYGSRGVPWVLLDAGGVQVRTTSINPGAVGAQVVEESSFPGVRKWVESYVLNPLPDVDALVAFGERDGRPTRWND